MFFPCIYFGFSLKPDKSLNFDLVFRIISILTEKSLDIKVGAKCHFWFRKCLQIKEMPQLDHLLCLTFYIHWRETEIMFCENLGMTKSWENLWLTSFAKLTDWSILIIQQSRRRFYADQQTMLETSLLSKAIVLTGFFVF